MLNMFFAQQLKDIICNKLFNSLELFDLSITFFSSICSNPLVKSCLKNQKI